MLNHKLWFYIPEINLFLSLPFEQSWGEKCCSYEENCDPEEVNLIHYIYAIQLSCIPLTLSTLYWTVPLPWRSQTGFLGTNWVPLLIRVSPLRGHSNQRRCHSKCSCMCEGNIVGPNAQLTSAAHRWLKHPFPENLGGGFKFSALGTFWLPSVLLFLLFNNDHFCSFFFFFTESSSLCGFVSQQYQ